MGKIIKHSGALLLRCTRRCITAAYKPTKRLGILFGLLLIPIALSAQTAAVLQEQIRPSQADQTVAHFDDVNVVLDPSQTATDAPLALFLPGTHGQPLNAITLLKVVAGQGYRVIGLTYDDDPPGTNLCPRNPNPDCFTNFHEVRVFGRGAGPISNPYNETIEARLVSLLHYLDHEHPGAGWSSYLRPDGLPEWSRILVSGLSQGAGMAAFIAKSRRVYRVVLFSSPWDNIGRQHRPAPWLFQASATPPERWWAERHVKENTTAWIANAYQALQLPKDHILLFDQELVGEENLEAKNPYHGSTIRNPAYGPQWQKMYGLRRPHSE